jgi:creatinine amidohydrolase
MGLRRISMKCFPVLLTSVLMFVYPMVLPGLDFTAESGVLLERLSWTQVRDAVKSGHTTVIVATGGVEQNGPYVATGKHNYIVRVMSEAIARKLGNALVAPVVKFVPEGNIDPPDGHMKYSGTISLSQETFSRLLTDICSSLKQHGFTDIVLIGDSGGNQKGMEDVSVSLSAKWKSDKTRVHYIPEYYQHDMWSYDLLKTLDVRQKPDVKSASRAGVHSDYHYESILAVVDPILIHARERIVSGDFSINGVDLSPLSRTVANGQKLIDYRSKITADTIRTAIKASRE